ncbi:MAG: RsmB/NOP family class I SAM-dependent RNA methyltransferase [Dysgonamonadaceae bacterium]|jgi:16S rRNA C967 or C1407 C5-methylase (RsmB/RsmF family)/NOL1/NOP2/fmu family ribosome biogenesis protein|nr:RsmB/NOP family class I SAM-dependent RNA methyltransferase [Dysgonamonadaceae bacterium]
MQLPETFITRTKALLGNDWPAFEQALQEEPPVSIRWNPGKKPAHEPFPCGEKVPWASHACYLPSRPSFTLDPLFHAGGYYVQEAASMYLETIVKKHLTQPVKVLDLCAAPGGKSTQLLSVLPEGSLLVANEVIRSRASVLAENVTKWGNPSAVVTNNDPAEIGRLAGFFDVLTADVPCSGEGMFRKDPAALQEWSVPHVRLCSERQKRIVADSWPALSPGGLLIYSTCTYNREENEENIRWICRELGAEPVEAPHRFLPHQTKGEGFFIAAVRKTGTKAEPIAKRVDAGRTLRRPKDFQATKAESPTGLKEYLLHPERFVILREKEQFLAFPALYQADYRILQQHLKILSAGVALGEQKGKDWIPAHALAMSTALAGQRFPCWEVDKATALRYLRKEALQEIPPGLPKGYLLVTYGHCPLGFVKNIGARANNLYPSDWRIRMQADF